MKLQDKPTVLMVSGGSDSVAMLVMCVRGDIVCGPLKVLHINHMLRGKDSDEDERFVVNVSQALGVMCQVKRTSVAENVKENKGGMEAVARALRYKFADEALDEWCHKNACAEHEGQIFTAHTLNDRVEMFYMRSLVGTGPGGLASIPRRRGRIMRPLLDYSREELRDYLRAQFPQKNDKEIWREDKTNYDGSNFRGQVRTQLVPVLENLRPGYMKSLSRTMDLIAEENDYQDSEVQSILVRNLEWDGTTAKLPLCVLKTLPKHYVRRALREALLIVEPNARLESKQIERIISNLHKEQFITEVSGAIRVSICSDVLVMRKRAEL